MFPLLWVTVGEHRNILEIQKVDNLKAIVASGWTCHTYADTKKTTVMNPNIP